jgi:hypothetical protein
MHKHQHTLRPLIVWGSRLVIPKYNRDFEDLACLLPMCNVLSTCYFHDCGQITTVRLRHSAPVKRVKLKRPQCSLEMMMNAR